jgi:hypothetical protein
MDWKRDGELRTDYTAGFFKEAMYNFKSQAENIKKRYTPDIPPESYSYEENGTVYKVEKSVKIETVVGERSWNFEGETVTEQNWFRLPIPTNKCNVKNSGGDVDWLTDKVLEYTVKKLPDMYAMGARRDGSKVLGRGYNIDEKPSVQKSLDTTLEDTNQFHAFKMVVEIFLKKTTTIKKSTLSYSQNDDTRELATIGYFDESKNSCINDRGSEIEYVRYHTQNPNIQNDSYLKLDVDDIKFI